MKPGGLHEKHAAASNSLENRKISAEMAFQRTF
jgi:hypothetical protein